ncbi:MAG TPA: response regulator [Mucilaginibacter sp.]|jgi:signal transduction histidine kinase|nr:response regulator [Mucilaginibacter sp.]
MSDKGDYAILVIEDNPGDYTLVEEFLTEQIEEPIISNARNYYEAKKILSAGENLFDIILLDLSLPDKTGIPLIQEIVAISSDIPIIVLTGYSDLAFGVSSLSLGVSDYILKDELTALSLYKSIVYNIERKRIVLALETSEKRARNFAKRLNDVLEEERSRIAREIHDEFGQQLSGLKMSLSSLKMNPGVNADVVPVIDAMMAEVNHSIQSLRQIANELRPVLIDKLGLFASLEWLVSEFEKKTGVVSHLYVDINQPPMTQTQEINIFRICQEALTNITKHAGANAVNMRIENKDDNLSIKIVDNGKGIGPDTPQNALSMGLLNMKERASLIGADLKISSFKDSGTLIELNLPTNGKENINS